eukprot:g3035.t1
MVGPLQCVSTASECAVVVQDNTTAAFYSQIAALEDNCTANGYSTGVNDQLATAGAFQWASLSVFPLILAWWA